MLKKLNLLPAVITVCLLNFGCDRQVCKNNNPIFDQYSPSSEEYKIELAKQLRIIDKSKLSYWFTEYSVSNGKEQLLFNVQGDGLCALILLDIKEWGKLEELRKMKGVSFRGAKFTNLKFDIEQDSIKTQFIYQDFNEIID